MLVDKLYLFLMNTDFLLYFIFIVNQHEHFESGKVKLTDKKNLYIKLLKYDNPKMTALFRFLEFTEIKRRTLSDYI